MFHKTQIAVLFLLCMFAVLLAQAPGRFRVARLQYGGGGDWYNDPSIIPNLQKYLSANTNLPSGLEEARVTLLDKELFNYPFLFMTGHGNIKFSEKEVVQLRKYLTGGGFLFADDDYGMDIYFRREMEKVFPQKRMLEIPFDHPIYHIYYEFNQGLPKIHEHDGGPPKGYGYFHEGRLVVFYAFNTNISDGWADPEVHKDPPQVRENALKMGTNIVLYALTN